MTEGSTPTEFDAVFRRAMLRTSLASVLLLTGIVLVLAIAPLHAVQWALPMVIMLAFLCSAHAHVQLVRHIVALSQRIDPGKHLLIELR